MHSRGEWHASAHIWIYDEHKHVLLQKRSQDNRNYPGHWDASVGGHVDSNESPLQAAVREMAEELGVTVEPHQLHHVRTSKADQWNQYYGQNHREFVHTYLLYLPHDTSFRAQAEELDDWRWAGVSELLEAATDTAGEQYVPHWGGAYWRDVAVWVQHARVPRRRQAVMSYLGLHHVRRIKYRLRALLSPQ